MQILFFFFFTTTFIKATGPCMPLAVSICLCSLQNVNSTVQWHLLLGSASLVILGDTIITRKCYSENDPCVLGIRVLPQPSEWTIDWSWIHCCILYQYTEKISLAFCNYTILYEFQNILNFLYLYCWNLIKIYFSVFMYDLVSIWKSVMSP